MRLAQRLVLLICLAVPGLAPLAAQDRPALARDLSAWYDEARQKAPGEWSVVVADADGTVLWSVNPEAELVPASTVKIFTTGFARTALGAEARRETRVIGRGRLDAAGEWHGTWTLEMNGDVTLERGWGVGPDLADLAEALHARGIRHLTGPLTVVSRLPSTETLRPAAWGNLHLGELYAPPVGAITLHENTVVFTITPNQADGPPRVTASPAGAERLVSVQARTVDGSHRRLALVADGQGGWELRGSLGRAAKPFQVSAVAERPELVLRAAWNAALADAGIAWTSSRPAERPPITSRPTVLATVSSPTYDAIAREVNRRSLNIGAELLLRWADPSATAPERLAAHVREVVGPEARVHLADGSGLSPENRTSALTQARYLARLPLRSAGFPLLLPVNGSGTLRRLGRGVLSPGAVRAKSGTLDNVSALAGYLGRRDGVLVIATIYNGPRRGSAKLAQWELFRRLGARGVTLARVASPAFGGDAAPEEGR